MTGPQKLKSPQREKRWQAFYDRFQAEIDPYGFKLETFRTFEPFFRFLYEGYFDVKIIGLENIPANGRAVLAGNHSGGLPLDAMLLLNGYFNHHPHPRRVRALAHGWLHKTHFLNRVISGMGGVPATFQTAVNLLENDELVVFYPEGARGTGKLYNSRYRLIDFDPGFVKAAILTGAPIIPVVTVGCDDLYPILKQARRLARFLDMPYFPVTPLFPWIPIFSSCLPLPAKVLIKIGKPIHLDYPPESAQDHSLRLKITREIQFKIQRDINRLLRKRKSIFAGWSAADLEAETEAN